MHRESDLGGLIPSHQAALPSNGGSKVRLCHSHMAQAMSRRLHRGINPGMEVHDSAKACNESSIGMLPYGTMEVDSGLQPAWIQLQTEVLSAYTCFQSLVNGHPIQRWLSRARRKAKSTDKIGHMSNLENIARQFPELATQGIIMVMPFRQAPWEAPRNARKSETSNSRTKQAQRIEIKKMAQTTWKSMLAKNTAKAKHSKQISTTEGSIAGPELYKMIKTRRQCALLSQLRTGHCGLNHYLWRFKKEESPNCEMCEGSHKETVEHCLINCKGFWKERGELRRKVGIEGMKVEALLGRKEHIGATLEFIKETGRFAKKD